MVDPDMEVSYCKLSRKVFRSPCRSSQVRRRYQNENHKKNMIKNMIIMMFLKNANQC